MNHPFIDRARCKPVDPDQNCRQCQRWAERPGQTWGKDVIVVVTENSKDPACIHVTLDDLQDE